MAMETSGVMPVYDMNRSDGEYGSGAFIWVIMLFFLLAWGGGGLFGGGNNAATQGALTRSDLCSEFNFNNLERSVGGIQNGLADGFYAMNSGMLSGFNGLQRDLCTGFASVAQGFDGVNANINQARFDAQSCCCETNRNIDSLRFQSEQNACAIMQNADRNTQRIIDHMCQNEMQTLRDSLQAANFQLSQQAQNAYLINAIHPSPIPAYTTANPYCSCTTTA